MIYLDNCSTTKIRDEVMEKFIKSLKDDFANPSSLHGIGFEVEKKLEKARGYIGSYLRVDRDEIYFTSGGTESNNLAISSVVNKFKNRGNHIITSSIEHPSVLNKFKHLESIGFDVSYIDVNNDGELDLKALSDQIREDTVLVSIMHVNNELGTISDINEISRLIEEKKSRALFHVDGVQAFGKIEFSLKELKVDLYSFSSHKIYGPKGVGGLYINKKNHLDPVIFGGNQESGFRSGTENSPAIIAFGEAVRILDENFDKENSHVKEIKNYFIEKLEDEIDDIKINGKIKKTSPYIVNISIRNTRGEVLLHYLEQDEIYISTSSACSSNDTEKSHVLRSIGLTDNEIEGSIRICFSYNTSREDIDYTIDKMKKAITEIREIMMR